MPKLTLYHCINAIDGMPDLAVDTAEIRTIKLPCSSMIRDFVLLRAFEASSDIVIVVACPENECHHTDGNTRARKRVERVKEILDSIGLDGRRLLFLNGLPEGTGIADVVREALSRLEDLGLSPVKSPALNHSQVTVQSG